MDHLIDDSDRLKPCPFCGGAAEMLTMPEDMEASAGAMFVQCTDSRCMASSALVFPLMDDVQPLLMERWNRRVMAPPQDMPQPSAAIGAQGRIGEVV